MGIYTYVFTSAFTVTRFRTYKGFFSGIPSILYAQSPYFHVTLRILLLSILLQENKIKF
jgi:hypothetical protein